MALGVSATMAGDFSSVAASATAKTISKLFMLKAPTA
jgi:hypothetical protein